MQIDAHQHFWQLARGDYEWLTPDLDGLYRDFLPEDLDPHRQQTGIDATVLVQAAATFDETRFLLEIASATPWVAGVVGWVDFEAPRDAVETCLDEIARHPKGVGIRPMIQDLPDPAWVADARRTPIFEMLVERDLRFDALVRPAHLGHLLARLEAHPELRTVIDHGAKPEIAAARMQPWARDLARIADETSAVCKLSGLPSEAGDDPGVDALRPFVEHLIGSFGAERLLWGSDWPVVESAGGYAAWRKTSEALLAPLGAADRERVFGGNARGFYGLDPG